MEPDHMNDQTFLMMYDEVIGAREAPLLIPDQVLTQKEAEPQREKIDELIEQLKSSDRDLILRAAIKLSDFYFIPWLNKQNFVNKLYFAERGGVQHLIKLMKTVTDPDLQMVIGSVVWNFGENYETLHILYESGALEPIKMFLDSNSTKLQYTGVGAIWGMMEYEVIQETAVKDGIMEKLVSLSVDALNMDAYATSERYRCFGCLQCSSTNANCRKVVFDHGADAVLKVADVENSFELLSVWFGIIILANLLVDSRFTQPLIDKGALQVIERFLNKVQTESIRAEEKEKGIVWSFVEHFFKWGDSGIPELESLSLFALAALSYLDHNRAVIAKFNMTDHLFCYQWFKTSKALEYMPIIFKNYERYNPPSLRSMCEVFVKQNFTKIGFKSKKELEEFLRTNNIPNVILE